MSENKILASNTTLSIGHFEDQLTQLTTQTQLWLESGVKQGLLEAHPEQQGAVHANHSARDLFAGQQKRPLVVGLFGGTGVGKSSLMNRFAKDQVARTGVERPTSREVTLFLHKNYEIKQLPENFPIQKVNIRQHQRESQRDIMWIDMPDIDSVEAENAEMVKDWLPFIDVVLYVVNPDRYRDARGWQYLLEQGYQQAWLFVINQWDLIQESDESEGDVLEDFRQLLSRVGFEHARIFCTDCLSQKQDDFSDLENSLVNFSQDHAMQEIETRGHARRAESLVAQIQQVNAELGEPDAMQVLSQHFEKDWQMMTLQVEQHLERHFQKIAGQFIRPDRSLRSRLLGQAVPTSITQSAVENDHAVWDQRSTLAMQDVVTKVLQQADQLGLPTRLFKSRLEKGLVDIADRMPHKIYDQMRRALSKPGRFWQRVAFGGARFLSVVLPIAALIWVGWRVVSVFYDAQSAEYFGLNFALHSGMLVLLAWAVPAFLKAQLQPSMEQTALRGLTAGLRDGLIETHAELKHDIRALDQLIGNYRETGKQLAHAAVEILPTDLIGKNPQLAALWQQRNPEQAQSD